MLDFSALKGSGYCKCSSQQRQGLSECRERRLGLSRSHTYGVEARRSPRTYSTQDTHTVASCLVHRSHLLIFGFGLFAATALGGAV